MQKYRRSRYLLFTLEELAGVSGAPVSTKWVATALLSGQHLLVSLEQLAQLQQISCSEWMSAPELEAMGYDQANLDELVRLAILLTDGGSSAGEKYLDRENQLESAQWPPVAAAFHLLNNHQESRNFSFGRIADATGSETDSDTESETETENRARRFFEKNGAPPPARFVHPTASEPVDLERERADGAIALTLLRRRTCRHFARESTLASKDFSRLLRLTFGPTAIRRLAGQLELFLKTSPSGGSLHPIEAFPLLFRCEGQESGLYHYRADRHGLALVRAIPEGEARRLAIYLAQGQSFVGTCSAVVILVARFDRNFWKYRRRENSYAVMMQDAGHLAQTFQLIATEIGLSVFYTAAINGEAIAGLLSLRYPNESALGLLGVGEGAAEDGDSAGIESWQPQP